MQGSGVDSDLNNTGILQARKFYEAYRHITFSDIFISTLKRTYQTIEPFLEQGLNLHTLKELDEINWGELEGKEPSEDNTRVFLNTLNRWSNGELDVSVANGETPLELYKRQKEGLDKIAAIQKHDPILICMHGRAMRSFLCLLTNTPLKDMDNFEHGNVCLYILEKTEVDSHYKILESNLRNHLHSDIL